MSAGLHKCFGCGKQIADHEPHIHVDMDEWAALAGAGEPLGLGLEIACCEDCTQVGGQWKLESHEIGESAT